MSKAQRRVRNLKLPARGSGFQFKRQGVLTLMTPDRKRGWDDSELIFRSLIVDRGMHVVSCGLPKFFDWQQHPGHAALLEAELTLGGASVQLTRKHDGTQIIRSVHRGRVLWRTRNHFDAQQFDGPVRQVVERRYPELADASVMADSSLQFEFVSPANRIVLPYDDDDLILIGGVDHSTLKLWTLEALQGIAHNLGLRLTETEQPAGVRSLADLQERVDADRENEGLVVRFSSGQRLVKVKSSAYRDAHRLRFAFNPQKVLDCVARKQPADIQALLTQLNVPVDDPITPTLRSWFDEIAGVDHAVARRAVALQEIADNHAGMPRKRFAAQVATPLGEPDAAALMLIRSGDMRAGREHLLRHHRNLLVRRLSA